MKKSVGLLSLILTASIAVNSVVPAMSQTIRDTFAQKPQTVSVNNAVGDYKLPDEEESTETESKPKEVAYDDGKILIYNFEQLSKIGSGESYEYADGITVTYDSDAEYKIAQNISLPRHTLWQLPKNFKGKITGEKQDYSPLYENASDTIYLYNPYQLAAMVMDNAEAETVREGDVTADTFGTGATVTVDTGSKVALTYSDEHNYSVSSQFTADYTQKAVSRSKKANIEAVGASAWDGTTVYKDGVIYIANFNQLQQIGTDTVVKSTDTNADTFGQGEAIHASGTGTEDDPYVDVKYSKDAVYFLTNDIPLPSRTGWAVPEGFTGMFTSADSDGKDNSVLRADDTRLYDNGKVYYHNVFPIAENAGAAIHDNDYDVMNYGTGGLYGRSYLTNHKYYIASNFTAKTEFDVTEYITATDEDGNSVNAIVITNYTQLKLVGLGESVIQTDTINGIDRVQKVNYPADAVYYLANDIELADDGWQLPDDFTGSFTCDPANKDTDATRLYVRHTGSATGADVYIQNIYQLENLGMSDEARSEEPVLDKDYDAAYVGAGTPIYLTNVSTDYLSYRKATTLGNKYILSRTFSNKRVDQISTTALGMIANPNHIDGRDYFGQTTVEIDGTAYILIGDRQQLDAIGTDKYVYGPVYAVTQTRNSIVDTWKIDENRVSLIYPGDADLITDIKLNPDGSQVKDFSESPLFSTDSTPYHSLGPERENTLERVVYCASDGKGGYNVRATSANANRGSEKYTRTAKYIVFRDIDMNKTDQTDKHWTPLMFSGEMYGVKAESSNDVSTLWSNGKTALSIDTERKPAISNTNVVQNGKLEVNDYIGIGFFATITNRTNTANIGVSGGTSIVKNLELHDIHVENNSTEAEVDQTLLNVVTKNLGKLLGGVVDVLLKVLSFGSANTDLNTTLSNLLNARANDPTIFATGAFAGRIVGDVLVEDCCVTGNVEVSNVKDRTGGFVGYTAGFTEYSGLTKVLGGTVEALAAILNVVPAVGLGDLVTILLGNAIPLENLIPTGYISPEVKSCEVQGLTGEIGNATTDMAGGFVGQQIGTHIEKCRVSDSTYTVKARDYGGGFCGLERDAEIKGTLDAVGVDLSSIVKNIHPQSVITDCSISNCEYTVTGDSYLGGFIGAMTSSYAVDCTIDCPQKPISIKGTGDYTGGFAGYATVGWQSDLGKNENNENSLLGTVKQLLTGVLSKDKAAGQNLLTLMGISPSAILGCQLYGSEIEVESGKGYAGGIVGKGEGIYLGKSNQEAYDTLAAWNSGTLKTTPQDKPVILSGVKSIKAAESYAGGVAGYMGSAAFQGLLNDVVGLGDFIGFTVNDITVTGIEGGYTVEAGNQDAGGGFGLAVGGTITNVKLNELKSVTADNRAGGFAGIAGPGQLAGTGGLTVNLLGLDRVLEVSNLLQIGKGLEVEITDCTVTGIDDGYTVTATGKPAKANDLTQFKASGFIADSNSTQILNSHAYKLKSVIASDSKGYAGGFVGTSTTGGLAEAAGNDTASVKSLIEANGLLGAIKYLIPTYTDCTVNYVDGGYVDADVAGGFVADMESGTVDNAVTKVNLTDKKDSEMTDADWTTIDISSWTKRTKELYDPEAVNPTGDIDKQFAVFNIDKVSGRTYGGGFGGKLRSGALANAGGGISILGDSQLGLNIGIDSLLNVMDSYIPIVRNAGVYSENGFTVAANEIRGDDPYSGSAGGFAGYASGAQISNSDVYKLKHTNVTAPSDLEADSAPSYFDGSQSTYAVTGGHYAGGYVGNMDIGSAASVGKGLKVLGENIALTNVLSALSVVVTTIEHSDVEGAGGGFSVIADGTDPDDGKVGVSGGFAGAVNGGHIQNSHCKNFYYIIGQEYAGGYVGNMVPGNVANLLDDASILGSLIDVDAALASLVESFIPTVRNSTTSCVPCGGAVRAQAASDATHQRGVAGGYCGHNEGGHIWGLNNNTWQDQNDGQVGSQNYGHSREGKYVGEQHKAAAFRIRSVYGYEYAGGFTGYMESADTADTGSIKLLGGLIKLDNILTALSAVYPTEEHTVVYGPLHNMDWETWNAWVSYVGKYGGYGGELSKAGAVSSQTELDGKLSKYIYGTNVVAGRSTHETMLVTEGGNAGGYVGYMVSGVVTDGQAYDTKLVRAMRSAGGYAGKMQAGAAASFGSVDILGLNLNVGNLVKAAQVFVPTVKSGSVQGWQSGMSVIATGTDYTHRCGYAGGYVGSAYGAQIWGDENADGSTPTGCNVNNLRYVKGTNAAGGYVGLATAASVADVNTNSSKGLLQRVLNTLISSPGDLASVMQATITTIREATVNPDNAEFGFTVEGANGTPPRMAGGFAGSLEATVVGNRKGGTKVTVNGLRRVDGQYYAGGFVGLADVGSVASVSNEGEDSTTILGLIKAGSVDVLDVFRTYIYDADVNGVSEGITVHATTSGSEGLLSETRHTGCAGGFAGGMMNGTIKRSNVTNLNTVAGINYTGGFIGHAGKNGAVDVDDAAVSGLVGLTAGVLDIFGTVVDDCNVSGYSQGIVISSASGNEPIAGGFVGYADVSQINNSHLTDLKQVYSGEIAGGFVGKTDMHYLIELEASSPLVQIVLKVVNALVKALYVDELERANLINLDSDLLGLKLLSDGDLLYVNLLGLKIGVSLVQSGEPGSTDTALITIGDSSIALPCSEDGIDMDNKNAEVAVNLIKGNRTKVENCSVKGIENGYDVYGGGAGNDQDGSGAKGYAGGFVGYNNEGKFTDNKMEYCDVVRGAAEKVGPFSGTTALQSVYSFNNLQSIEGENNTYSVYRKTTLKYALTQGNPGTQIGTQAVADGDYKRVDVTHLAEPIVPAQNEAYYLIFEKWKDAVLASSVKGYGAVPIKVYASNAKAVLMLDTPTDVNDQNLVPNPGESKDPCDETIKLTIQKVWQDNNNGFGARPLSIKVRILQWKTDTEGNKIDGSSIVFIDSTLIPDVDTTEGWFNISKEAHERAGTATWTRVIDGLPVHTDDKETYYAYTVEEAPVVGYTTEITYDESGSTATAKIVNTKKLEILFRYYDRYEVDGIPAGINSEETTYTAPVKSIPGRLITFDDESKVAKSINYSNLIGSKAVEFSEKGLAVNNVMCDYDLWTSQKDAVTAMGKRTYFVDGEAVNYNAETIYHTDYLGKPLSEGEKWVSYYDENGNELEESFDNTSNCLKVSKIVVWCYNYPKQYNVDIYGANDKNDLVKKTVAGNTVYVADAKNTDTDATWLNGKFYYNQRFGDKTGQTDLDDPGFIKNYGLKGYTDVQPADYAAESFDDYTFAYWAYNQEGTQIASVEREFKYRVTTNTKLYAVYANGSSKPGISISANTNDTFVDSNGVSKTRLNIIGSIYGAPDYDKNVQKLSFLNISLSEQIRNHPEIYTPEKINALFEQYKDQLIGIIQENDTNNGSKPFTLDKTYDGALDDETGELLSNLQLTLTTKGYIYTVVSNGNTAGAGESTANLTNKNRAHFTISYKTSALNINNTGSKGNTCLMYCGALKYNGEWSLSTNCLIYFNGKVVDNTSDKWE